jgi:hypothetical protein
VSTSTVERMLESSARRPIRSSSSAVRRAVVGTFALGVLLTGCTQEKKVAPDPAPTPIANLNTVAMQVPRMEFCGLVRDAAISEALDGKPDADAAYGNGDEEELPEIGTEVVHEIGCSWTKDDDTAARAWVFARPITPTFAQTVIASGKKTPGCRTVPGPAYGKPSATQLCRFPDGEQRVRHAGLFGQTWLTCELAATRLQMAELRARTDRWCVEVANALDTAR